LAKQGLELKTEYTNPPLGSFSLGTGSAGAKTQLDGTGKVDTGFIRYSPIFPDEASEPTQRRLRIPSALRGM